MVQIRYDRAIIRNIHEIGLARFDRAALIGLNRAGATRDWSFFHVSQLALFNDMVAHAIRVLDRNRQSASFWYLYGSNAGAVDQYVQSRGINWGLISEVSDKLKVIRDGTHFHIDEKGILDPRAVWRKADLRANNFGRCLSYLWLIVNRLHMLRFNYAFDAPKYDGSDVAAILAAARRSGAILS